MSSYHFWFHLLHVPSAQLNCLKGFIIIIILCTVGSSKDCENGPIFNSKVEDLADTILSFGPAVDFILSRPVTSYLNKEAGLELS